MANKTSIEWAEITTNPIRARNVATGAIGHFCEKVSAGCANCYASNRQVRLGLPEFKGNPQGAPLSAEPLPAPYQYTDIAIGDVAVFLCMEELDKMSRRRAAARVFWCSMSDMFGWWVPDWWIDGCVAAMMLANSCEHLILTKRPERMSMYFRGYTVENLERGLHVLRDCGRVNTLENKSTREVVDLAKAHFAARGYLPNITVGTSVENNPTAAARIPELQSCPASRRFLSVEPQIGDIRWKDEWASGIHLAIFGGESGPRSRPYFVEWMVAGNKWCQRNGVAAFNKQLGSRPYDRVVLEDYKGGDEREWPKSCPIVRQWSVPQAPVTITLFGGESGEYA